VENANKYLNKFSTLIRRILQHSTSSTILLREEIQMLELYLELEKLRLGDKMDYCIEVADGLYSEELRIPAMIIQPYVENAIKHGVAPLRDRAGLIRIAIQRSPAGIECTVEDDGPGIDASLATSGIGAAGHIPLGATITARRIDTINAIEKSRIRVTISDKARDGKPHTGTVVHLYFPHSNC
jgi:sensor histidine kinase YesM